MTLLNSAKALPVADAPAGYLYVLIPYSEIELRNARPHKCLRAHVQLVRKDKIKQVPITEEPAETPPEDEAA